MINDFLNLAWKNLTGQYRALTSTSSETFEPQIWAILITQDSHMAELGKILAAMFQNLVQSLFSEEWRLSQQQTNAHGLMFRRRHTFVHAVFMYPAVWQLCDEDWLGVQGS